MSFKETYSFDKRVQLAIKIRKSYPDKIPLIVEVAKSNNNDDLNLSQTKYLVPIDSTMGQFLTELRKNLKLTSKDAIFLFVHTPKGDVLVPIGRPLGEIYENYKEPCGFLYITVAREAVFGSAENA